MQEAGADSKLGIHDTSCHDDEDADDDSDDDDDDDHDDDDDDVIDILLFHTYVSSSSSSYHLIHPYTIVLLPSRVSFHLSRWN